MLLALISLAVSSPQTVATDGAPLYAPPVVRPFEPPSNFGRVTAEGDGRGDPRRRPIDHPVAVGAYRASYEFAPTSAEAAYDRGVVEAESGMDARMGPLDGRWRVRDASGAEILTLALTDEGPARPLEGAWRRDGTPTESGVIDRAERSNAGVVLAWRDGGLTLRPSGDGWVGELTEAGRRRAVTLAR
ncbi:hypothetical protein [Brevundimonas sp. LM2]|uniref:hypothetical protein n=1 Tax=Brevundimonas sp. LM2 TaxID=1938605 RepID=UPI00123735A9|nr:hypothetical protein [Brevundimonas sp. LM2]